MESAQSIERSAKLKRSGIGGKIDDLKVDLKKNMAIYLFMLPGIIYFLVFQIVPMFGIIIAFQDYSIGAGFSGSEFVGLKHFTHFFSSPNSVRVIRNTLMLSGLTLLWGFPAPIILALCLNEVGNMKFKKAVQNITYLPHFISMVVICGMIVDFTASDGFITQLATFFGGDGKNMLQNPDNFRFIYVASGIWQTIGWGSIIYLSALSGIDPMLYEAAIVDGANRWKQTLYITLPCLAPTIVVMLIMRIGRLMNVGFEKVFLLYSPLTYEKADIIATFVYRRGMEMADYSYSTAIGLFNSAVSLILIVSANYISRKVNDTSLW